VASEGQNFGEGLLPLFFQGTDFVAECKNPTKGTSEQIMFQQQARNK
jgi:hypothetical protein